MARRDAEENRQRILAAFAALIRQNPDKPPSMSDIVKASGLGRGTVYRHFPDIGSLAFAQLDEGYRELFSAFRADLKNVGSDRMEAAFVGFLARCHRFASENKVLLLAPECQNSKAYAHAKETLRTLIAEALCALSVNRLEPADLTRWADVIAHCVEAEHIRFGGEDEQSRQNSVTLALKILRMAVSDR